ncbi:MAG: tRNA 2-selenouridine(34) synthase MnmH [Gammaproteobacteria bacterium]|nr:tRNA 2-selenouridine(34) synthase MnmH [Gammaproteobacteria bacterium]
MPAAITAQGFDDLFLDQRPMFDVRAPIEFAKGALPNAINLPLMTDDERQRIGTCYKEQGQQAAIAMGHQLVNGATKKQRVQQWHAFAIAHPNAVLYCFRGGLRSKVSQQWLSEAGIAIPFVEGGYKALRSHLIKRLDQLIEQLPAFVLSGRTGTGKTEILPLFKRTIDLEGIAKHRGSSFGKYIAEQPTQINFENNLAMALMQLNRVSQAPIIYEDESRLVGCRLLPNSLQAKLKTSPIMVLNDSFDARIDRIFGEYVVKAIAAWEHEFRDPREAFLAFSDSLLQSMFRIRKRLGSEAYTHLVKLLKQALYQQSEKNNLADHKHWIAYLLTYYYDPMYDYQLSLKTKRVMMQGTSSELVTWYQSNNT